MARRIDTMPPDTEVVVDYFADLRVSDAQRASDGEERGVGSRIRETLDQRAGPHHPGRTEEQDAHRTAITGVAAGTVLSARAA